MIRALSEQVSNRAAGCLSAQVVAGVTTTFAYNAANQLCNTGTSGTPACPNANWAYDANGNTTKIPTITSLVYNGQLLLPDRRSPLGHPRHQFRWQRRAPYRVLGAAAVAGGPLAAVGVGIAAVGIYGIA
jgi:hypothetical protein